MYQRIILLILLPFLGFSQVPQAINNNLFTKSSSFNLDELKVLWKKVALENCPGVPCVTAPSISCGTSAISDIDGNSYNTVLIGTQCWTKENLKVTKYNDGSTIPDSTNSTWGTAAIGARTGYIGVGTPSSGYVGTYGYLYNWYAVTDAKNLCPTGWHVPTDGDWTSLMQFIDPTAIAGVRGPQNTTAGGKMKSTSTLWNTATPPSPGTDNYGFSALPGGHRGYGGIFDGIRNDACFWSATADDSNYAWNRWLLHYSGDIYRVSSFKYYGASVRCLRD